MVSNWAFLKVCCLLFLSSHLVAQPVLTRANTAFVSGDVQVHTFYWAPGTTSGGNGANVTWDYSQLTPRTDLSNHPSTHIFYDSVHPSWGATIYSIGYMGNYVNVNTYLVENTHMSLKGESFTQPQTSIRREYIDPMLIVPFPFTYTDSCSDSFAYHYYYNYDVNTNQSAYSASADAYGTLILPGGAILTDVLRLKLKLFNADSYAWYKPGIHGPVFRWSINGGPGGLPTATSYITTVTSSSDFVETDHTFKIFPNPAKGSVTIHSKSNQSGPVTANLLNALGQEVRKQVFASANADNYFSLENVPAGIYFLDLQSGDQKVTQKLVVE